MDQAPNRLIDSQDFVKMFLANAMGTAGPAAPDVA